MPLNYFSEPALRMAEGGIIINLVLMVLNLVPLPPLDGGRIAVSLLPHKLAYQFARVEPYGMIILMVLLFTGVLGAVMMPVIGAAWLVLKFIFGI